MLPVPSQLSPAPKRPPTVWSNVSVYTTQKVGFDLLLQSAFWISEGYRLLAHAAFAPHRIRRTSLVVLGVVVEHVELESVVSAHVTCATVKLDSQ